MANILVVDDECLIPPLLRDCLERYGHTVKLAHSAIGAMGWFDLEDFDLAIIDVKMPGPLNGLDLVGTIRCDPRAAGTRILVISGMPDMERSARAAGADSFLPKPFDLTDIVTFVNELLAIKRQNWTPRPGLSIKDAIRLYSC